MKTAHLYMTNEFCFDMAIGLIDDLEAYEDMNSPDAVHLTMEVVGSKPYTLSVKKFMIKKLAGLGTYHRPHLIIHQSLPAAF